MTIAASIVESALAAYSHIPHHPGKGKVFDRFLPYLLTAGVRQRTRYGVRFECDLSDNLTREIYYTGFDRRDSRVVRSLVRRGDVVIDAGANIGYFSLLAAKNGATVHSFEPFPQTADRMQRNLELNPTLCITLHRLALSDHLGEFFMDSPQTGNQGRNRLAANGTIGVKLTTLDDFCEANHIVPTFIKIDVEGAELALLLGAEHTIRKHRPILMVEVNESTLRGFGLHSSDLVQRLRSFGYELKIAGRYFGLKPLTAVPRYGEEPNVFCFS